MRDIIVKLVNFPTTKIRACITPNEDGTHTIFVNAKLSTYQQAKAVRHEIDHYFKDDFSKSDVNEIEKNNI